MLKGAIVGFGQVAVHGHWPAYASSPDLRIVAIVERAKERRAMAQQLCPEIKSFATLDELAAHTTIDFVDICTPPALHADAVLNALGHGWNVICEKPLFLDAAEFELARKKADATRRCIFPIHNWKFAPIIKHATELLSTGEIGRLSRVEIETQRVHDCEVSDPDRPNWRRDPAIAGGGILMDHGWHAIYLALGWFRESPIGLRAALHRAEDSPVEDEARLEIHFPSGNANISLTWNAASRRNTLLLIGERGRIVIDDDTLQIDGKVIRFDQRLSHGSYHAEWFAAMLPHVIATFRDPSIANAMVEEAAVCLSLIQQAYRANPLLIETSAIKKSS